MHVQMNSTKIWLCRNMFLTLALIYVSSFASAQNSLMDTIVKKFDQHRINFPQEKIYVHIDQELYLTGETLWFKIYYVDGSLHRPLDISKVAYVEVLDKDNLAVLQTKVSLKDGEGSGSLFLPASISSGNYHLRAYTHWMKNLSPDYYFQTSITLINSFRKIELEKPKVAKRFSAQFFPEGGNLVYRLKSKVGFQVTNSDGKGINFNGLLLNHQNDTITTIKPLKYGIGNFTFTPIPGETYRALLTDTTGYTQTFNLPAPLDQGYVMDVRDSTSDLLAVSVTSASTTVSSPPAIYFFIHARQIISFAEMRYAQSGKATIVVNKKELGEGISHITILDSNLHPQCERLYFKPSAKKLIIEANVNQREYGIRRKVVLNISAHDQQATEKSGSLSVAVVKIDSLHRNLNGNIFNYLWLTSDLNGNVESPDYYLNNNSPEGVLAIDNLMLTHGWRRFNWNEVLNKKRQPIFLPEYRGHLIRGTILDINGSRVGGVATYLSTPGKNIQLYPARSNANGDVQYEMRDFFGSRKIIVQSDSEEGSTNQIKIHSPYSDAFSSRTLSTLEIFPEVEKNLLSRSVAMQVQDIFYSDNTSKFSISKIDSSAFYGRADETYFLDDYTRFPVMEEVMREYVPGVMVRKRNGRFHFMLLDDIKKSVFQDNPLILLDGIPIFDVDKIMEFDPTRVKKLEVVTRRYYLGPLIFPGIVSYTTYTGDLAGFQLDPKSVSLDYEGLQLQRIFYSPQYDSQKQRESRMPDRRTLLFWAPQVNLDKGGKQQLEFYTSDLTGDYIIIIEGLTKSGFSGSSTSLFTVKQFNN